MECRSPFINRAPLDENGRCLLCRRGLAGFDAAFAFGEYESELRKLIHLFKYGRIAPLAEPLGILMTRALPRTEKFDVLVPMPLHWLRRWRRGFNQSYLLARVISRRTGIPVANALRRRKRTSSQAGLTSAKRRLNVSGAFEIKKPDFITGRRILLVDDVLTTGASAGACAASLKRAGAASVAVLTLARVDRRRGFSGRSIS